MLLQSLLRKRAWAGIAILAAATVCVAQPSQTHRRASRKRAEKPAATAAVRAVPAAAAQPSSPARPQLPMEQPPQPATITLSGGKLAVNADNSSLIAIIHQLARSGGMSISGLGQDQRVFGVYGPGDPRQILSELLEGAGYNVLMTGVTPEGTPRELVLSARGDAPPSPPQSFPAQSFPQPPYYQRQPGPPGNLNFPMRSPAQMYQQMMQQRQQQQDQQQPPQ